MPKKTKSKARLDKFYDLAKLQGLRSRAAFKLIQLNKKHHFLENSTVLIDLCAAPGGWLQVASQTMPSSSIIIGVDLDPIKPIPNVITFQEDITTDACLQRIRKELKHLKADVVLNDGAPNVGSNWSKDAYTQSELVLLAFGLASKVLRTGGMFVTKVFRSADYMTLVNLFSQLFGKVEANKPEASRVMSAEIFLVCKNFLGFEKVKPEHLDPKKVFLVPDRQHVDSIKKIFQGKRREIPDNAPATMFKRMTLREFLCASNPYQIFVDYNKIELGEGELELYGKYAKIPPDFEEYCADLKLLGEGQIRSMLRWRSKVNFKMAKAEKQEKKDQDEEEKEEEEEEEEENQLEQEEEEPEQEEEEAAENEEGEAVIEPISLKNQISTLRKNRERKLLEKIKKNAKLGVASAEEVDDAELADFNFTENQKEFKKAKYIDLDALNEQAVAQNKTILSKISKAEAQKQMEENLEFLYEEKKKNKAAQAERLEEKNRFKQEKLERKKEKLVDLPIAIPDKTAWFERDIFKGIENPQASKNPKDAKKDKKGEKADKIKDAKEAKEDKKGDKKGKKDVREEEAEKKKEVLKANFNMESDSDSELDEEFHGLPERKEFEPIDEEEAAELLALSRKMLRKKSRREILDQAYNRYNIPEDPSTLPAWFVEDERRAIGKIPQITKEDIQRERERLNFYKHRLPMKVIEAKYRKKKRLINRLNKAKVAAEAVMANDSLTPLTKGRELNKLYSKARSGSKEPRRKLVVMKSHASGAPRSKTGRKFKVVDRRLKKDVRAQKRIAKKKGKR